MMAELPKYKRKGYWRILLWKKHITVLLTFGLLCFLGGIYWTREFETYWTEYLVKSRVYLFFGLSGILLHLGYGYGRNKKTFPIADHISILLSALFFGICLYFLEPLYPLNDDLDTLIRLFLWLNGLLFLVYITKSAWVVVLSSIVLFALVSGSLLILDSNYPKSLFPDALILIYSQYFGLFLFVMSSFLYGKVRNPRVIRLYRLASILWIIITVIFFSFNSVIENFRCPDHFSNSVEFLVLLAASYVVMCGLILYNLWRNPSQSQFNVTENLFALVILTGISALNISMLLETMLSLFWFFFNLLLVLMIISLYRVGRTRRSVIILNFSFICFILFISIKFLESFKKYFDYGVTWLAFGTLLILGSILLDRLWRKMEEDMT